MGVLDISLILLVLVVIGAAFPTGRRMLLQRPVGTFACSVRVGAAANGKGWAYGVGRYHGDRVEWFRIRSLSLRPRHVFVRREVQLRGRRAPRAEEMHWIPTSAMVVECALSGTIIELAMSADALTGFLSWMEAAPPGQHMVA
jgi:hypothetical protein